MPFISVSTFRAYCPVIAPLHSRYKFTLNKKHLQKERAITDENVGNRYTTMKSSIVHN